MSGSAFGKKTRQPIIIIIILRQAESSNAVHGIPSWILLYKFPRDNSAAIHSIVQEPRSFSQPTGGGRAANSLFSMERRISAPVWSRPANVS